MRWHNWIANVGMDRLYTNGLQFCSFGEPAPSLGERRLLLACAYLSYGGWAWAFIINRQSWRMSFIVSLSLARDG